eukprot:GFKZ01000351.1.p1 GENE.GFKZ01000351.1~~GFKZ01000351.1.p1  ORF type:complete len:422 (-),score=61.04 GFKZ01000351.1:454-1719(-)
MSHPSFVSPIPRPLRPHTNHFLNISYIPSRRPKQKIFPSMIQLPNEDGPPDLDAFFNKQRRAVGTSGAPITLATARQLISNHQMNATNATLAALATATDTLQRPPQLVHVTHALDVDAHDVRTAIINEISVPIVGRTVQKKDAAGTVELLLLRSDVAGGIAVGEARVASLEDDPIAAAESAARSAAQQALEKLQGDCTFLLFAHSPTATEDAVRRGINKAKNGVIAYGGPARGDGATELGWTLLTSTALVREGGGCAVVVAAVPGSLSFLFSAVIKNWAQPAYVEPLEYLRPTYVGDPELDLLTAIRFDDWNKFVQCVEEHGVDVNCKWVNKQNQTPLLAACARARTRIIEYLLQRGADVSHRNDGGFTAVMYTRKLVEYDRAVILNQLDMLEKAGADITLTPEDIQKLKDSGSGDIVELN